ncbi:autotransporter outer membrane beta-barrel domain-containing protein [Streptomyces fulvoviolaceus]|uniref:hypothetical protein n=1 Tax=Streptomyces fulvoviolaceus TaxID=285535 RepID=UPI0021BF40A8|nr:hypothetical protein [Streptomyces fulvoviolaceus]MCT9077372.1 hypothetical protein [Streptomyces fulvoviolaceus]
MTRTSRTGPEVAYRARPRALLVAVAAVFAPTLAAPAVAHAASPKSTKAGTRITVGSGETLELTGTTTACVLTIEEGGVITVPDGYRLSLTVNGVETGSDLAELTDGYGGAATAIAAGTYRGTVVLSVAEANDLAFSDLTFPFRQALYVDVDGVDEAKSVPSAVLGGTVTDTAASNVRLLSDGESFNGVYVTGGGTYTLTNPKIAYTGNGRCDFIGYGASVVGTGEGTTLVLDGATISNEGVVRTAVIADATANVIVKNSTLHCADGTVPDEYPTAGTGDTRYMITVPWMLGLSGNVRTTNLLGTSTKASFVNSTISSEKWGALSVDGGSYCTLTAINSTIANTGDEGYGSYAIGNVTEHFLGCTFDVGDYALIHWGASAHYGDSTKDAVAALNDSLDIGLTSAELNALPVKSTVVNAGRFMVLWYAVGSVAIDGGTQVNTGETAFMCKAVAGSVTVDGSEGASISAGNGVIFQLMDTDRPSSVSVSGKPWKTETIGTYTEPTGSPAKSSSWVTTSAQSTDAKATFTDIDLKGDFYNSVWGGGNASLQGQNLTLSFTRSSVEGVISASTTKHSVSTITSAEYRRISEVTNTTSAVVNNGVLVTLGSGSTWTVTGTSYLSALTLASDATVTAPSGRTVTLTVDGTATELKAGSSYTGALTLTVA